MVTALRPARGGFLLPFGCGWFIREFLLGHAPEGSPTIDPDKGACQEDIFSYYKEALITAYAEDAAVREEERRAKREKRPISPDKIEELTRYYSERIPYKLHRARYHSFQRYFHWLKQLGWVEFTGEEETSAIQPYYPDAPPRKYYRLTRKGVDAPDYEWSRPQFTLYPEINGIPFKQYFEEKRKKYHYSKRK
ncbi:hypothetical protein ES703_94240 [subsurface metagenome]